MYTPFVEEELNKLNIPQLKSLCKTFDGKIVGYSKANKTIIVAKLLEYATAHSLTTFLVPDKVDAPAKPKAAKAGGDSAANDSTAPPTKKVKSKLMSSGNNSMDVPMDLDEQTSSLKRPADDLAAGAPPVKKKQKAAVDGAADGVAPPKKTKKKAEVGGDAKKAAAMSTKLAEKVQTPTRTLPSSSTTTIPLVIDLSQDSPPAITLTATETTVTAQSVAEYQSKTVSSFKKASTTKRPALDDSSTAPEAKHPKLTKKTVESTPLNIVPAKAKQSSKLAITTNTITKHDAKPADPKPLPLAIKAPQASFTEAQLPTTLKQKGAKRFTPLVLAKKPATNKKPKLESSATMVAPTKSVVAPVPTSSTSSNTRMDSLPTLPPASLHFPIRTISFQSISLPPSLSARKHLVGKFALLLSAVRDPVDLKNCSLVSKTFRYGCACLSDSLWVMLILGSVYLSVQHRVSREYAGKRHEAILTKYRGKIHMLDMWPYLHLRRQERSERKRLFEGSFLGRVLQGKTPIANRLFASPDVDTQMHVIVRSVPEITYLLVFNQVCRFLLTRLFFAVNGYEGNTEGFYRRADLKDWKDTMIVEAQPVGSSCTEVWRIVVEHRDGRTDTFFVLERTCEAIGPPAVSATGIDTNDPGAVTQFSALRRDWADYLGQRITPIASSTAPTPPSLLDHLAWTNHEEFDRGISRLWLKRIEAEGDVGVAKKVAAERYILASVVENRCAS